MQARLDRQQTLFDQRRRFEFVLAEAAVRWRLCPAAQMLAQIDRLLSLMPLPHIDLRIIRLASDAPVFHANSFVVYGQPEADDVCVKVETVTGSLTIRHHDDARYLAVFTQLREAGTGGEDARRLLMAIADDLRR